MESMDNLHVRVEALEGYVRRVERRLRWWRGIACGVVLLGLVRLPLPSGTAQDESAAKAGKGLAQRLEAVEYKLQYVTSGADEVVITGANLRIVNGLGATNTTNGLGNLLVGYNEPRTDPALPPDVRTGSHNVVVGREHNFSSFGGLVVAQVNEISGPWAVVSGGTRNLARGVNAAVSGGTGNTASGLNAAVSGGDHNTASGDRSAVSGGAGNLASGLLAAVSGGAGNTASGIESSVSGGTNNTASGFSDTEISASSVSGGLGNTASGQFSSVSGGSKRSAPAQFNWAAGALFSDN